MCPKVPDPPANLQLSCDHGEDGKVDVSWSPPNKAHGLVREYIVSSGPGSCETVSAREKKASPPLTLQVEFSEKGGLDWTSHRCSATQLEVKDLQPDTLYRFRVRHTHTHRVREPV